MAFRLPDKCRKYFEPLTNKQGKKDKNKLDFWFDGYYLSALVGIAQVKMDDNPDSSSELVDDYPTSYKENIDFIAALLIATEAKRISVNMKNADELENLMTSLVDSQSKTRLSSEGVSRLNKYASRGINIILENMMQHTNLEEFYQDYYDCFDGGKFTANA
jgi:hypothetical protein